MLKGVVNKGGGIVINDGLLNRIKLGTYWWIKYGKHVCKLLNCKVIWGNGKLDRFKS